jgi:hypothetical protein
MIYLLCVILGLSIANIINQREIIRNQKYMIRLSQMISTKVNVFGDK